MISAVELIKRMANASIFGIIIGKFRYKKKLCLIILFKGDKSSKVYFYCTILFFGLTICLRVKGDEKFLLDA